MDNSKEQPMEELTCDEHGHDYKPLMGFDNVISDYQCMVCGKFETDNINVNNHEQN